MTERLLRVGAIAISHRHANAVGPVRLSCEREALRIDLLRVGRFAAGFAFVGLADVASYRVPYRAVRALLRDGQLLLLAIDPEVASPYNRFALGHFSHDPDAALLRAFRVRSWAALTSYLVPIPFAAAVLSWLPRTLVGGPLGSAAVALLVALTTFVVVRRLVRSVGWGGPLADTLRDAFAARLSERLGLEPVAPEGALDSSGPPAAAEPVQPTLTGALGTVSRPVALGLAAVLGLAAAGAAALAVKRYGVAAEVKLPVPTARSGLGAPVRGRFAAAVTEGTPKRPACDCRRPISPLWRQGVPVMSVLVSPRVGTVAALWLELGRSYPIGYPEQPPGVRPRADLDVAVVNNSALALGAVDLVVTFWRRDEGGVRRNITERGLHWAGKLAPGEAVKWRVRAPGTELRVESRVSGALGDGDLGPASADAFHRLREARLPPVRVHAAMMLAYLRDRRAQAVASGLGPVGPLGERAQALILATLAPVVACDPRPVRGALRACLFNGTDNLERHLSVVELTDPGAPAKPRRWTIADLFLPGRGLEVDLPLGGRPPPTELAVAEPSDTGSSVLAPR